MKNKLFILCISLLFSISLNAQQDAISVLSPETTVMASDSITYNVQYTKSITEDAYVLVRFKAANGDNLEFAIETVSATTGTIPLTLKAPDVVGSNYSIQAQLLKADGTWGGLKTYNQSGFTVVNTIVSNTITVLSPQTTVLKDNLITYNVKYTKTIPQDAYVLIRFKDENGGNLEFDIETVSANSGTIPLTVKAPNAIGSNYSIQAQLLKADGTWGGLKNYNLDGGITVRVVGGNGGDVNNLNQVVHYAPGENNDFHKQNLGNGYWTNWFIDQSWLGEMSAQFGPSQTPAYIKFDNQGGHNGHGEIDIKIQKASWSENSTSTRGYPSKIDDVSSNLACKIEGSWGEVNPGEQSKGRAFINMTAWIYNVENIDDSTNISYRKRCDVIVHTWDNSGALHEKYAYKEANQPSEGYKVLNSFTSNGVAYHVLKKNGGNGETATFNLVPKANLRFSTNPNNVVTAAQWQGDFETSVSSYTVNMEDILNKLIISENNTNKDPVGITDQWYIHVLEWTVVPSGQDSVDGVTIGNAKGIYNINSYTIPNLLGNPLAKSSDAEAKKETSLSNEENLLLNDVVSIYPNPFKDSFTYTYNPKNKASLNVELYSVTGKKVNINNSNSTESSTTVDTSNLSSGIYIVRISSDEEVITKKIIKN